LHALREAGFAPDWRRFDTEAEFIESMDRGFDVILCGYRMPLKSPVTRRFLKNADKGNCAEWLAFNGKPSQLSPANERQKGENQENDEANFRNHRGGAGDDPESQNAGDQGNDQKDDGVVKHKSRL
jgi:hypothetical protein